MKLGHLVVLVIVLVVMQSCAASSPAPSLSSQARVVIEHTIDFLPETQTWFMTFAFKEVSGEVGAEISKRVLKTITQAGEWWVEPHGSHEENIKVLLGGLGSSISEFSLIDRK